jgi:hypothetical protein
MAGRVLKIDIAIDENGQARRAASEIESSLKKVEQTAGTSTKDAIDRLNKKFEEAEAAVNKASESVKTLEKNHRDHEKQVASSDTTLQGLIKTIGVYLSAQAIWGAITSTAAWGSELEGLSRRLKIPVDDLQRLGFAAKQNGLDLGGVAGAIGILEQRIGDDNTGTAGALNKLGIGFEHIRSSNPMALFMRISDAVTQIRDPFEQAQRVQAVFGREGNELLPLLTGNLRDLMDQADKVGAVMSPGLAKKAADADTAFANFTSTGKVFIAEFLEPALPLMTALANKDFSKTKESLLDLGLSFSTLGLMNRQDIMGWLGSVVGVSVNQMPGGVPSLPPSPPKPRAPDLPIDPAGLMDPQTGALSSEETRIEQTLAKQLALQNQLAAIEKERQRIIFQSGEDLRRALEASKAAFDTELSNAFLANLRAIKQETYEVRDGFLAMTLATTAGPGDNGISALQRYQTTQKYQRRIDEVDPRATNAGDVIRRIQAEQELAFLQIRQQSEGVTTALADDLNAYRIKFADVIGQLPVEFQGVVPPIVSASATLRNSLTGDLDAVRGHTDNVTQGFALLQGNLHATKQEIADGLMATDRAYRDAGFLVQQDPDVTRLRRQQTGGIIFSAAGGYVEPTYLARGGPAGTDTVPAFLTPGEGVLSRTGMTALDRLNAGGSIGRGGKTEIALHIDARGAQFNDEASMTRLVERVKNELGVVAERLGMAG